MSDTQHPLYVCSRIVHLDASGDPAAPPTPPHLTEEERRLMFDAIYRYVGTTHEEL